MKKTIVYFLSFFIILSTVLSVTSFAADGQGVRIVYTDGETPLSGVTFYAYKVGTVSGSEIIPESAFEGYPVSFDVSSVEKAHDLATTLYTYVIGDSLHPDYTDITDANGIADFDGARFEEGAYLFIAKKHLQDGKYYYCVPAIVEIPFDDSDTVTIKPKFEEEIIEESTSYKVIKSWIGDSASSRPVSVTVELLKDGDVYDTVVLSAGNNWRYQWDNLSTSFYWSVREVNVPSGYTVTVTIHGNTFLITNERETVTEPTTNINTTEPDVTTPTDTTTTSHTTEPIITSPTANTSTTASQTTTPEEDKPELPATGMVVRPIPYLALIGMIVFMLGFVIYRKSEIKHG